MTHLARITEHPTDPDVVLIDIPYELNAEMRRYEAARMAPELRGYVLAAEHIDGFTRFAERLNMHVVDERRHAPNPRPLMPECAHCGQPAKLSSQPEYCPGCGQQFEPYFHAETPGESRVSCEYCGHPNKPGFGYCAECGKPMPKIPVTYVRQPSRTRLKNPKRLAETLGETQLLLTDLSTDPSVTQAS
jgi:DNA-directed RNA polymerase subunit RPC12/RpoP